MKVARRSFFSMLGGQAAATAAALNLPEPDKSEYYEARCGLFVLSYDRPLSRKAYASIRESLKPFEEEVGIKILVLERGFTLTKPGQAEALPLPTIVDAVDGRCGHRRRVYLDEVDVTDEIFRAELFSDGRGIVYSHKKNADGRFIIEASGTETLKEQRIGKVEFGEPITELRRAIDPDKEWPI
jgi:hypothetical protein